MGAFRGPGLRGVGHAAPIGGGPQFLPVQGPPGGPPGRRKISDLGAEGVGGPIPGPTGRCGRFFLAVPRGGAPIPKTLWHQKGSSCGPFWGQNARGRQAASSTRIKGAAHGGHWWTGGRDYMPRPGRFRKRGGPSKSFLEGRGWESRGGKGGDSGRVARSWAGGPRGLSHGAPPSNRAGMNNPKTANGSGAKKKKPSGRQGFHLRL